MSISFSDRLAQRVIKVGNPVCVGLDPRWESLPEQLRGVDANATLDSKASAYRQFCTDIIDVVADKVPVVKPQAAFFEQLGPAGMVALGEVVQHASAAGLIVIMDGKRNDIGTTAEAYADAYLGSGLLSPWGSDSLTVSPYLGEDSIQPFVDVAVKRFSGIFVLVKTSNPGGGFLQDQVVQGQTVYRKMVVQGQTVYRKMADFVQQCNQGHIGQSGYGPVGAVVGATYPAQLAELRAAMQSSWILIPGYGAQGGTAADVAVGFDDRGLGAIVNSSRGIIFAHSNKKYSGCSTWQAAVEMATNDMIAEMPKPKAIR